MNSKKKSALLSDQIQADVPASTAGKKDSSMVHELNNSLQIMLGIIEELEEKLGEGEAKPNILSLKEELFRCCQILNSDRKKLPYTP